MVSSAKLFRPKHFAELTTPAAPISERIHLLMARPPLLCEEGNIYRISQHCQFIHTFIDRRYRMQSRSEYFFTPRERNARIRALDGKKILTIR